MLGFITGSFNLSLVKHRHVVVWCVKEEGGTSKKKRVLAPSMSPLRFAKISAANALSGACLGPLLDNYHSQFGALIYSNPIHIGGLTTTWWTPMLFALAGIVIGDGVLVIDGIMKARSSSSSSAPQDRAIRVPRVLYSISLFTFQYYLSGLLDALNTSNGIIFAVLAVVGGGIWWTLDRSVAGICLGLLTALCGPGIELGLINLAAAYKYTSPDWLGIPIWIIPVYFAGAPAVGNLSRLYSSLIKD